MARKTWPRPGPSSQRAVRGTHGPHGPHSACPSTAPHPGFAPSGVHTGAGGQVGAARAGTGEPWSHRWVRGGGSRTGRLGVQAQLVMSVSLGPLGLLQLIPVDGGWGVNLPLSGGRTSESRVPAWPGLAGPSPWDGASSLGPHTGQALVSASAYQDPAAAWGSHPRDHICASAPPKGPAASRPHTGDWSFDVRVWGIAHVQSIGGAWGMAPGASDGPGGGGRVWDGPTDLSFPASGDSVPA